MRKARIYDSSPTTYQTPLTQSIREGLLPVVLEGKLHAIVVDVKPVSEVHASAELELTAHSDLGGRMIKQIGECIMALVKIGWVLCVRVIDVDHGVAG